MKTIIVGKGKKYTSLVDALFYACDGDEITLEPGYYEAPEIITKKVSIKCSLNLLKAFNNFSSYDIPIIQIKSFKTLKISNECHFDNILFTQKNKIKFQNIANLMKHNSEAGKFANSDDLIRNITDSNFQTMLHLYSDTTFNNCFFLSSSLHSITVESGSCILSNSIIANSFGDNILSFNKSIIKITNKTKIYYAINGYGIHLNDNSELYVEDSSISFNEGSNVCSFGNSKIEIQRSTLNNSKSPSIILHDKSTAIINSTLIMKNSFHGIACLNNSSLSITNSTIDDNNGGGIVQKDESKSFIKNSTLSNNNEYGIVISDNTFLEGSGLKLINDNKGIAFIQNSSGIISNSSIEKCINGGVVLNDNSKAMLIKLKLSKIKSAIYLQDYSTIDAQHISVFDSEFGFYVKNLSKTKVIDTQISNCNHGIYMKDQSSLEGCSLKFKGCKESGCLISDYCKAKLLQSIYMENQYGIFHSSSSEFFISNSVFTENRFGLSIKESSSTSISNNKFNKQEVGLIYNGNCKSFLFENEFTSNEAAIYILESKNDLFSFSNIILKNKTGIYISDVSNNAVFTKDCIFTNEVSDIIKISHESKTSFNNLLFFDCKIHNTEGIKFINEKKIPSKIENQIYSIKNNPQEKIKSLHIEKIFDVLTQCDSLYERDKKHVKSLIKDLIPKLDTEQTLLFSLFNASSSKELMYCILDNYNISVRDKDRLIERILRLSI